MVTSTVAAELILCNYCICVLLICSAEIQYIVCHVQLVVVSYVSFVIYQLSSIMCVCWINKKAAKS